MSHIMCISKRLKPYSLGLTILAGLITGSGILPGTDYLCTFSQLSSDIFMRLLKLVSLPIIFLSITTTISGLEKYDDLKHTGSQVLRYTISTTLCAATIALILFLIFDPANAELINMVPGQTIEAPKMRYIDYLVNVIPSNMIQASVSYTHLTLPTKA